MQARKDGRRPQIEASFCAAMPNGKGAEVGFVRETRRRNLCRIPAAKGAHRGVNPNVSDKIRSFISEMSTDARKIYAKWDEYPQFRRCQLGAGVIFEHQDASNTTVCDLKIQGSGIEINKKRAHSSYRTILLSLDMARPGLSSFLTGL
jgi:hypothetical protein